MAITESGSKRKPVKRHRAWKWVLIGVGGVAALLLLLAVVLSLLLFGSRRAPGTVTMLTSEEQIAFFDLQLALQDTVKAVDEGTAEDAEATITITPEQLRALLKALRNELTIGCNLIREETEPGVDGIELDFDGRNIKVEMTLYSGYRWVWGGAATVRFAVHPGMDAEKITAEIDYFKVGAITLPRAALQRSLDKTLLETGELEEMEMFRKIVKSISIDAGGNLHIVYYPVRLHELVASSPEASLLLLGK